MSIRARFVCTIGPFFQQNVMQWIIFFNKLFCMTCLPLTFYHVGAFVGPRVVGCVGRLVVGNVGDFVGTRVVGEVGLLVVGTVGK
jgi:hypothetical protein